MGLKGLIISGLLRKVLMKKIIEEIYSMGHEVGYHYEDFVFARQKAKGKRKKMR